MTSFLDKVKVETCKRIQGGLAQKRNWFRPRTDEIHTWLRPHGESAIFNSN